MFTVTIFILLFGCITSGILLGRKQGFKLKAWWSFGVGIIAAIGWTFPALLFINLKDDQRSQVLKILADPLWDWVRYNCPLSSLIEESLGIILTTLLIFLSSWICSRIIPQLSIAVSGAVLSLIIIFFGIYLAAIGGTALIIMFKGMVFAEKNVILLLILLLLIFVSFYCVWLFLSSRSSEGGKETVRTLLPLFLLFGGFLILYVGGSALTLLYAYNVQKRAMEHGIVASVRHRDDMIIIRLSRPPSIAGRELEYLGLEDTDLESFTLPLSAEDFAGQDWADQREFLISNFDSPGIAQYLQDFEAYLEEKITDNDREDYYHFEHYLKLRTGRALLFDYTGQIDKVIPELQTVQRSQERFWPQIPASSNYFKRIYFDMIWVRALVYAGSENSENASYYREMLKLILSREYRTLNGCKVELGMLECFQRESFLWQMFHIPLQAFYAKSLNTSLDELEWAERSNIIDLIRGGSENDSNSIALIRLFAREYYRIHNATILALALKLYKCEKGQYPASLYELTPEYLSEIPVNLKTGKSYKYVTDLNSFAQIYSSDNEEKDDIEVMFQIGKSR